MSLFYHTISSTGLLCTLQNSTVKARFSEFCLLFRLKTVKTVPSFGCWTCLGVAFPGTPTNLHLVPSKHGICIYIYIHLHFVDFYGTCEKHVFNLPLQCDEKARASTNAWRQIWPIISKTIKSTSDIHFLIISQNSNGTLDLFKVIFYFLPMITHHSTTILRNLVGTFSNHRTSKIQTGHPLVMSHCIGNQSTRHLIYNEADVWTTVRGKPSPTDFRRRCCSSRWRNASGMQIFLQYLKSTWHSPYILVIWILY